MDFRFWKRTDDFKRGAEWMLKEAQKHGHKAVWNCWHNGCCTLGTSEERMVDVKFLETIFKRLN